VFEGLRVLITGGAGFIGSELTRQVGETAGEVVVVDNLVNGKRENVSEVLSEEIHLETTDIRDGDAMRRLFKGIDIVFHLACLGVRHSIFAPRENHNVNATATLDLLAIAREASVKRFVYVSSSEVYGTARWTPMNEDHPPFPHTVYGSSKLAGDCYARSYWETYRFPTVVVRPFNSYGPRSHFEGDSGEVIPKFLMRAIVGRPMIIFGSGDQTRDFTFVSDTARGISLAGTSESAVGETFNLGSGTEVSINDLAGMVAEVVGKPEAPTEKIEPRPGDVLRLCSDSSKIRTHLAYSPEVDLPRGLAKLKEHLLASETPIEDLLKLEKVRNWQGDGEAG
jgi:UDP-glucose 4-epimerase